jgi:hypothetical protein
VYDDLLCTDPESATAIIYNYNVYKSFDRTLYKLYLRVRCTTTSSCTHPASTPAPRARPTQVREGEGEGEGGEGERAGGMGGEGEGEGDKTKKETENGKWGRTGGGWGMGVMMSEWALWGC